jgi:hypothetical protein
MWRLIPIAFAAVLMAGCGGQRPTGSPNDPNEQQGNTKAKPEKSITGAVGKERGDNQAGRNAHNGRAGANDNK